MIIEYTATAEDVIAFNNYHWKNTKSLRWRIWRLIGIVSLLALFFAYMTARRSLAGGATIPQALVACLPLLILAGVMPFLINWLFRRNIKKTVHALLRNGKNRSLIGPKHYVITSENITATSEASTVITARNGIEGIANDEKRIYIYDSSMTALIIPRDSITNGADFDEAWKLIQECYGRAQKGTVP